MRPQQQHGYGPRDGTASSTSTAAGLRVIRHAARSPPSCPAPRPLLLPRPLRCPSSPHPPPHPLPPMVRFDVTATDFPPQQFLRNIDQLPRFLPAPPASAIDSAPFLYQTLPPLPDLPILSTSTPLHPRALHRPSISLALSGGVDSSVSLFLLLEAGYSVYPVYMRTWDPLDESSDPSSTCPDSRDRQDAASVCRHLGVELEEADFVRDYWLGVFDPLLDGYRGNRTPNPDVHCNRLIKCGRLLDWVRERRGQGELLATGHYARTQRVYGDAGDPARRALRRLRPARRRAHRPRTPRRPAPLLLLTLSSLSPLLSLLHLPPPHRRGIPSPLLPPPRPRVLSSAAADDAAADGDRRAQGPDLFPLPHPPLRPPRPHLPPRLPPQIRHPPPRPPRRPPHRLQARQHGHMHGRPQTLPRLPRTLPTPHTRVVRDAGGVSAGRAWGTGGVYDRAEGEGAGAATTAVCGGEGGWRRCGGGGRPTAPAGAAR